jgi:long-chain acyl-CoA synthetase
MTDTVFTTEPVRPFERDTLPKIFFAAVDRFDAQAAVTYRRGDDWHSLSHGEVEEQVLSLAAALDAIGVEAGSRVAILSENRPEWLVVDYAVLGLGAVDVPLYPTLPANQLEYILSDAGASVLFVSSREQLDKVFPLKDSVEPLEHIVVFDDIPAARGVLSFSELLLQGRTHIADGRRAEFRERALAVDPESLATLIYTSGTTGDPKGVMLTHYNLAYMVAATGQSTSLELSPGDVALSMLPLSHVFERAVDYYYWDQGATIAYAGPINQVSGDFMAVRPHVCVSVPRLFEKIHAAVTGSPGVKGKIARWAARVGSDRVDALEQDGRSTPPISYRLADRLVFSKLRARLGGRMRTFISGGAPLNPEVARFFYAAGLPIHEGYGLTETSPVLASNRPERLRFGTVGVPYPGVELRIGSDDEILARSPGMMKGYWNSPDATSAAIDDDGWFHTGDVGRFDAEGFLRITDRLKDLIVTAGGKSIAPQPVELNAAQSPFVAQAVMIGDRRPYPVLLVVPEWEKLAEWARDQGIAIQDRLAAVRDMKIRDFFELEVLQKLQGFARFELPKRITLLPDELTVEEGLLTPTLKVKRRAVEERFDGLIEALYADTERTP